MKRYLSMALCLAMLLTMMIGLAPLGLAEAAGAVPGSFYNLADFEAIAGKKLDAFTDSPIFADRVASGELPPVADRLPENPLVLQTLDEVGIYGGTLRVESINIDSDWHLRHINAANLIEWAADPAWDTSSTVYGATQQPGVFESFSMSPDGLVFSATIRKGLKWSDGTPVTTEDVAFRVNDIYLNKELYPATPTWLTWGEQATEFTVIDDRTFEFKFAVPYGSFIEANVTMWPGTFHRLIVPSHYLKPQHQDYADPEELKAYMAEDDYTDISEWPEFFNRKIDRLWGCDAVYLDGTRTVPTLKPWITVDDLGNGNFRLERNPYYYLVDQEGNQLPYIDYIARNYVADSEMQNMSIIAGNVDVSCMSIGIESFPLYVEHEDAGNYKALPLPAWQDQIYLACFNANAGIKPPTLSSVKTGTVATTVSDDDYDPGLAEVYGDVRFRRAMSLALDRETMLNTLFLGLGRPAQVAPRKGTPFYRDGMEESYVEYDPEAAKALLDEMGMTVGDDGWRVRPDGKPFVMRFDYFVITSASIPGSELCTRYWREVGINVELKLVDVPYWFDNLQGTNLNEVTTWWLSGSGANLLQDWFLGPTMIVPTWNLYTRYKAIHAMGEMSDEDWNEILDLVPEWQREMQDLRLQIKSEPDPDKRNEIATRIWELQAEWLPIIGIATDTKSPMILSKDIGNCDTVEDVGYAYITVMELADQMYFKNPDRRN